MIVGFALFYLFIGVLLTFYKKGHYIIPYILFLNIYSAWITDFVFPLEQGEQRLFDGISKYYTYYCFILFFFIKKKNMDLSLLWAFVLTALYFILIYSLRGIGPIVGLRYAVSTFGSIFFFYVVLYIAPSKKQIRNLVKWNLIIQSIIGFLQLFGAFHYEMNIGETFVGTSYITGSFTGNNIYAEVISLLAILLCSFDYSDKGKPHPTSILLLIMVLVFVFLTGVRTALLADVIAFVFFLFIYYKDRPYFKSRLIAVFFVLGILAFSIYEVANENAIIRDRDAGNPIERQLNGVREISNTENVEKSTLVLSIFLWEYFIKSPIIGPGLYYTSSSGYGGIVAEGTENTTDATIMFYLCEVGIIGVLCFVLIYGLAFNRFNQAKGPFVVFLYIFMISFTDAGFTGFEYVLYIYLSIYYENLLMYRKRHSHLFV